MSTPQLNILFLPKWYPNEFDAFDGNFLENYAVALADNIRLSILFVHSEVKKDNNYRIVNKSNKQYEEIHVYFQKSTIGIGILDKIITAFRYKKAQELGLVELTVKDFNLCHVHVLTRSALLALSLLKKKGIPFVISEHWSGYHAHVNGYKGFLKKVFTQYVVRKAKAVHAVSTELKESMLSHHLYNHYSIIPNVVDTTLFKQKEKTTSDKIEVLFVGNLLQRPKRILDIIKSMANISKVRNDFKLSIYGEGKEETKCRELIDELNLNELITLKGVRNRAEIAEIMATSDFLFLFSEFENQPCVINEVQACGIPVVVPDLKGISERMNEQLGITFEANNIEAFENAFLQMLDTYQNYDTNYIRSFGVMHYSELAISEQFTNFYKEALAR